MTITILNPKQKIRLPNENQTGTRAGGNTGSKLLRRKSMNSKTAEDNVLSSLIDEIVNDGKCAEDAFLISRLNAMISDGLLGDVGSVTGESIINFIKNYGKG
jgi:hypothetical protein